MSAQTDGPYAGPTAEDMERDLNAAGWERRGATVWESPSGELFRGPFGAWKALKNMEST